MRTYRAEFTAKGTIRETWEIPVSDDVPEDAVDEDYIYEHITDGTCVENNTDDEEDRTLMSFEEITR